MSKRSTPDGIHGARLQVDKDSPGHILSTRSFVVVHVDPLQLQVGGALRNCKVDTSSWDLERAPRSTYSVGAGGVDAMFIRNDFPELKKVKVEV